MGKAIQKKWFGPAATSGAQIIVNGVRWEDNTTSTGAYIVKQTGSAAYVVSNGTKSEICFMVNANGVGALKPGQCFINATLFGGATLPCSKIAQYKLSTYNVANSVPREVGDPAVQGETDYTWSTQPATRAGQANLITTAELGAPVNTVAPVASGSTTAGGTLSVTAGTWTGNPTITYSYQWTLDAVAIPGATTATSPTTVAGTYLCVVTATNGAGSAAASSNSIVVA